MGKIKSEDKKTICGQRIHPRLIVGTFHKHAGKRLGAFGLEVQQLARDGMIETEAESVEGEAADGVVAVAILDVAADGAAEILRVDADLVFAPRFEFQFEERIVSVGAHGAVVRDGILAAAWVVGRGVGEICLIVFQPTFHRALGLLRLARDEGVIAAVGNDVAPVVLQNLLRFERLGIDKQAGGVAVEAMHHVRPLLDVAFVEIIVENSLDAERMVRGGHRKDADALLNNHEVLVFVNQFHEIAAQLRFGLRLADFHRHAGAQGEVVGTCYLFVNEHAAARENGLGAVVADAVERFLYERKQRVGFLDLEGCVAVLCVAAHGCERYDVGAK